MTQYEVYDFSRPTALAREQSRGLELAFETFTRQWGTQLTTKTKTRAQIAFEGVEVRTYDEYASDLPTQTAMVLFHVEQSPSGGKAIVQFPGSAALSWITRMLGGAPDHDDPLWAPAERPFTIIEQELVKKLLEDTADDLKYSFGAQLEGDLTLESIHHNSQFAQANGPADLMVVAGFRVTVADHTAPATIALPADAVLPSLVGAQAALTRGDAAELVRAQLAQVPVELALELEPRAMTAASVIAMAVGDVIRLPHPSHKPLNVAIDGTVVARASAGTTGSRVACVVVETEE